MLEVIVVGGDRGEDAVSVYWITGYSRSVHIEPNNVYIEYFARLMLEIKGWLMW